MKRKNENGVFISLKKLKKIKPRDPYTYHIQNIKNKCFCIYFPAGLISGAVIVLFGFILSKQ